jgi:hypothetical protein
VVCCTSNIKTHARVRREDPRDHASVRQPHLHRLHAASVGAVEAWRPGKLPRLSQILHTELFASDLGRIRVQKSLICGRRSSVVCVGRLGSSTRLWTSNRTLLARPCVVWSNNQTLHHENKTSGTVLGLRQSGQGRSVGWSA